jgi:hypothetical protein
MEATVTVVSATQTPTATPVMVSILTGPYPNPSTGGPVAVNVQVPGPSTVKWSVFTLSFRKVGGGEVSINSTGIIYWDLRDNYGSKVADGLYYLRLEVAGLQPKVKVFKVLVIR